MESLKKMRRGTTLAVLVAGLLVTACIPLFTNGVFQTARLTVELDRALAAGESRLVLTTVFSEDFKVKKDFVQVSGRLTPIDGTELPDRVTVSMEIEDVASGKLVQRVTLKLDIAADGSFLGSARVRKNIAAGEMMTVMVEPAGSDLTAGTQLAVCVDLVGKKGSLASLPACIADQDDDSDDAPDPLATFSSLQADFFNPTCSRAGCHSAASASGGLVLAPGEAYGNLVDVASTQRTDLDRVTPNDPERSYLIKKLRGDADIGGDRMPQGGPFLTDAQLARFVAWIADGAPDN